ncbi:peptide-methionine (S)-S-oxide reductase MsrA [Vibrio methylphosphonaticus]|uniref:peptide-methionine (S)-S-oxide reductase MsrA n=1 Tax=Vibrio methylphosphonaticus TaxID=2946866 RepID=UPI00202A44E0|nr:peptide-methionine (S)-S-oxide reductase MsrA [Vibrio methylphosphonaticus]MCL9777083.1 peptide-methionine (S)-S-oxide reductase MsrA [Vibrio methylphosphonaticus]
MRKTDMISEAEALPGRENAIATMEPHFIFHNDVTAPLAENEESIIVGLGCFWGAERVFWQLPGITTTSVGYAGGYTPNPTYEEVCSGMTGHTEVVRIVYNITRTTLTDLLKVFWEKHDPTQGMRQGNDVGTQYRSAIYCNDDQQLALAQTTKQQFQRALGDKGDIQTEIKLSNQYYFAEVYHQQYLAKNPNGYCGIGGTGVCFPPQ